MSSSGCSSMRHVGRLAAQPASPSISTSTRAKTYAATTMAARVATNWPARESSNTDIDGFVLFQDGGKHGGGGMRPPQRAGPRAHRLEFVRMGHQVADAV